MLPCSFNIAVDGRELAGRCPRRLRRDARGHPALETIHC